MENTKLKKWAIIAGLLIACCILIALIGNSFAKKPQADDIPQSSSTAQGEVTPNPSSNAEEKDIVIAPNPDSKPSSTGSADNTGTEQIIQPDPVKPEAPESPAPPKDTDLTNPNSKPAPSEPPKADNSKNDKANEGKIYVPGYGWIEDEGGGGIGEDTGSDGDWDKMIGY